MHTGLLSDVPEQTALCSEVLALSHKKRAETGKNEECFQP